MGYYLVDHPNRTTPQFGWQRNSVSGVIGVHTAENNTCFNGPDAGAEGVASFIGTRSDYGSYHVLADADSIIHLVHPSWAAWADTTNNAHGMSVSGAVRANDWLNMSVANRRGVVINMAHGAAQMVQEAVRYGLLAAPTPARRISPQEAISGSRAGFYGHGETNPGTRYDPGQHFDWNLFLTTYAAAIGGAITPQANDITPAKPKELFTVAQFDDLMAKMHEAVNQTNKALSEATNAKVAANEARDLARKALSEATNAKVAAREGVARISTVSGGSGATADQIVDELADRLKEQP